MSSFEQLNKKLNDEAQELSCIVKDGNSTENQRNRLAAIIYPKLRYFIWSYLKESEETEEVLQTVIEKIFKNIHTYKPEFRFTTWIYTIARNESLYHISEKKKKRTVSYDTLLSAPVQKDNSAENLVREETVRDIYVLTLEIIARMPDSLEKKILIDKDVKRMKGNEIAEKYEMNLNTVKTKLRKIRKTIKDLVIEQRPELKKMSISF